MKQAMAEVAATASNSRSLMTTQNATTTRRTDGSSLKDDSFASGLRSGFLLDGVCAKKTSKSTASAPSKDKADDTPGIIKPKKSGDDDSTSTLRLDEVQKALHSELLDKKGMLVQCGCTFRPSSVVATWHLSRLDDG